MLHRRCRLNCRWGQVLGTSSGCPASQATRPLSSARRMKRSVVGHAVAVFFEHRRNAEQRRVFAERDLSGIA